MTLLALCSSCAPKDLALAEAVSWLCEHGVGELALHREPTRGEVVALARPKRRPRIVAVYADGVVSGVGRPLLVVEGGAAGEHREASLLELCRRLHGMRDFPVALRTPAGPGEHPALHEIELVWSEVGVGYFHDTARGDGEFLEAGARRLSGVAFDPLAFEDLGALREALPAAAPAVVECGAEDVAEAVRRARGVFRA